MEQANCVNCGQSARGVIVTFPTPEVRMRIEQAIPSDFRSAWHRVDDESVWFHLKLLYDCLPYWQEFYDLTGWKPRWGHKADEHLSWDTLVTLTPKLFIDDIIESDSIRMMMQPIVDVVNCKVVGYEMLARGIERDGVSVISPGELYSAARAQNQLFRLDRTCRVAAIKAATQLPADVLIFVNFVPTSIYVPEHCLTTTLAAVRQAGINRERIVFEVVETDRVEDLKHLSGILSYYRERGFHCALDDYGQGFSDEQTMNVLQPDIIKLDRKYVTDIHKSAEKRRVAERIYHQGNAVGARMLAEGIESEDEAIALAKIGYHLQQGYWYGRPQWEPVPVPMAQLLKVHQVMAT